MSKIIQIISLLAGQLPRAMIHCVLLRYRPLSCPAGLALTICYISYKKNICYIVRNTSFCRLAVWNMYNLKMLDLLSAIYLERWGLEHILILRYRPPKNLHSPSSFSFECPSNKLLISTLGECSNYKVQAMFHCWLSVYWLLHWSSFYCYRDLR